MNTQTALSIEQMRELQSLGLDCSDASLAWVISIDGKYTLYSMEDAKFASKILEREFIPAYTLEDIMLHLSGSYESGYIGSIIVSYLKRKNLSFWTVSCEEADNCLSEKGKTGFSLMEAAFNLLKKVHS